MYEERQSSLVAERQSPVVFAPVPVPGRISGEQVIHVRLDAAPLLWSFLPSVFGES